jgi:hypothetical protein
MYVCMHTRAFSYVAAYIVRITSFIWIGKCLQNVILPHIFASFWQHTRAMLQLYRITVSCMIFRLRAQISTVSWLLSLVNSL